MNVGLYELKTNLSAILKEIEASGETVKITRHGQPVAELKAIVPEKKSPKFGFLAGETYWMSPDFDQDALGWEDFFEGESGEPATRVAEPTRDTSR